jgi:hypothetical protein
MRKTTKIIIMMLAALAVASAILVIWDAPGNKLGLLVEREAIEKTVQAYFKSEMDRNFKEVYAHLAPSSTYRKTHTYQEYRKEAEKSPVIIRTFRIVDIYRLRDNDNRKDYPFVDKFVQVEVDVEINLKGSATKSAYNYSFTFLKEKGAWYKG